MRTAWVNTEVPKMAITPSLLEVLARTNFSQGHDTFFSGWIGGREYTHGQDSGLSVEVTSLREFPSRSPRELANSDRPDSNAGRVR